MMTYRNAAIAVAISAILHLVAVVFSGFASESLILLPFFAVYLAFSYGLTRQMRWLAYLVFVVMLIGSIAAIGGAAGISAVPSWIFWAIFVFDVLAAVILFVILWRSKLARI